MSLGLVFTLEFLPESFLDSSLDDIGEVLLGLRHAKGNHSAKRKVESILLSEKIDAAKDKAEAKIELPLTGNIE